MSTRTSYLYFFFNFSSQIAKLASGQDAQIENEGGLFLWTNPIFLYTTLWHFCLLIIKLEKYLFYTNALTDLLADKIWRYQNEKKTKYGVEEF